MTVKRNELLEPENYFEGYQEKIEELKNRPEAIELDKLFYLVFQTEDGKHLLEIIKERYLMPGFVNPNNPNAANGALYYEGFKEAFRMILGSIRAHSHRIEAEKHNQ
jgi:hypothetical protein